MNLPPENILSKDKHLYIYVLYKKEIRISHHFVIEKGKILIMNKLILNSSVNI